MILVSRGYDNVWPLCKLVNTLGYKTGYSILLIVLHKAYAICEVSHLSVHFVLCFVLPACNI